MKTSELSGPTLDWAVAKCEGASPLISWDKRLYGAIGDTFDYSTDWSQGGPIIEREGIDLKSTRPSWGKWSAFIPKWTKGAGMYETHEQHAPTPLIAAMRCYVASKLGDTVDIPEGLKC